MNIYTKKMKKCSGKIHIVILVVLFTLLFHVNVYAEIYGSLLSCIINEQPTNAIGKIGDKINFTVKASNVKTYDWEYCSAGQNDWYSLGENFSGYNSGTVTIDLTNNYRLTNSYRCKLTGTDGKTKYTNSVKVEDGNPVIITSQPTDAIGKIGDKINFTVEALNVKAYDWEYRSAGQNDWYSLGKNFSGYNSDTVTIALTNNYRLTNSYRCKLTGTDGKTKYTNSVKVEDGKTVIITSQPTDAIGKIGDKINFTVEASNVKAYDWEYCSAGQNDWYSLGKNFSGYNSDTVVIDLTNNYRLTNRYRCKLTGTDGKTKYTNSVMVEDEKPVIITSQPTDAIGKIGDKINFTVEASNVKAYDWEYCSAGQNDWYSLGKNFSGYNSDTVVIDLTNNYRLTNSYRCKLIGTDGKIEYTNSVKVEDVKPVTITSQPRDAIGKIGDKIKFTVEATNVNTYDWEYCSAGQNKWYSLGKGFSGYNSDTVTIDLTNNYRLTNSYRCKLIGNDGEIAYSVLCKVNKIYIEEWETPILER